MQRKTAQKHNNRHRRSSPRADRSRNRSLERTPCPSRTKERAPQPPASLSPFLPILFFFPCATEHRVPNRQRIAIDRSDTPLGCLDEPIRYAASQTKRNAGRRVSRSMRSTSTRGEGDYMSAPPRRPPPCLESGGNAGGRILQSNPTRSEFGGGGILSHFHPIIPSNRKKNGFFIQFTSTSVETEASIISIVTRKPVVVAVHTNHNPLDFQFNLLQ